jgi:hypothetical protein
LIKPGSNPIDDAISERILELTTLLDADIAEVFDPDNRPKPMEEIPSAVRKLVVSLRIRERHSANGEIISRSVAIEFRDRLPLMKELWRLIGDRLPSVKVSETDKTVLNT